MDITTRLTVAAEQLFDRRVDFGAQGRHHPAEPFGLAALLFELLQIVAYRLFARKGRERTEDSREETDRFAFLRGVIADPFGTRIDIDEPPVDLALARKNALYHKTQRTLEARREQEVSEEEEARQKAEQDAKDAQEAARLAAAQPKKKKSSICSVS